MTVTWMVSCVSDFHSYWFFRHNIIIFCNILKSNTNMVSSNSNPSHHSIRIFRQNITVYCIVCMYNKMSSAYRLILWCENQCGWTGALKLMERFPLSPGTVSGLSPFIKHYEGLSYNREDLHRRHLRARREAQSQEYTLQLDFTAFHR